MKVVFRADASLKIGNGHVMRCLALAEALRDQGAECQFICGSQEGNMLQAISDKGFKASGIDTFIDWELDLEKTQAVLVESTVHWVVVDHYSLDIRWEQTIKTHCHKLMVIDDLADRQHDCDSLLDQNLGRVKSDYAQLVPNTCQLLIGPEYALLRPEFATWREYSLKRRAGNPELKHILISMGGTDYPNSTSQILQALKETSLPLGCRLTVVMGGSSPWIQQVMDIAKAMPFHTEVKVNVSNMAELMANSDLAIGAAGSTSWERCCLGLPSLIACTADNQREVFKALLACSAAGYLDLQTLNGLNISIGQLQAAYGKGSLRALSLVAAHINDGFGCQRVCDALSHSM
jgi:UDP-2,4-diacetamido-2,4,6-trideoxy-beta-L-altropyranose hydrolase